MLILARHGRTEHNATGRLLGRLDPSLDELGRSQAVAVGAALAQPGRSTEAIRIVTSPLRRTRETAEAIAAALTEQRGIEIAVTVDEQWIELDYGDYDGLPLAEVPPVMWATWRNDPTFCPPNGESLASLGIRVRAALDQLSDEARERDVIVVSHVSPIKAAVAWALDVGDEVSWRMFLAPASLTRIGFNPFGASLHSFNQTGHLA